MVVGEEFINIRTFAKCLKKLEENIENNKKRIDTLTREKETKSNKIKSFEEVKTLFKKKFINFFTINGHSKILETQKLIKKLFCLICIISLFSAFVFYAYQNVTDYKENNVVTQIKIKETETMPFPTVTICMQERKQVNNSIVISPLNLSNVLDECYFESAINKCSIQDFENFQVYHSNQNIDLSCYQFNGGRNASNHQIKIRQSTKFGTRTGLTMKLNWSPNDYLIYHVSDKNTRPTFTELNHYLTPFRLVLIGIKKTIDTKLQEPYSPCKNGINSDSSHLVKQILEKKLAYRKVYCYDLCLNEYASLSNISRFDAYGSISFSYERNCSRFCPLECVTNIFEITETKLTFLVNTTVHNVNPFEINFYLSANKYTELTQVVKTTEADFISNSGGVMGLFLDISFYHVYSFLAFILDLII